MLQQAGLGAIQDPWSQTPPNGKVFEYVDKATFLTSDATYPRGLLNSGRCGLVWIPDSGITLDAAKTANLSYSVDQGYGAYVEANSIESVENSPTKYHTTTGIDVLNPNIAYYEDCNDRSLPAGRFYRSTRVGSCFAYGDMTQPYAQTGNFAFEGGQGNYKAFQPFVGFLTGVSQVLKTGAESLTNRPSGYDRAFAAKGMSYETTNEAPAWRSTAHHAHLLPISREAANERSRTAAARSQGEHHHQSGGHRAGTLSGKGAQNRGELPPVRQRRFL